MKRQEEVVKAFIDCVNSGAMSREEAILLMEDQQSYPGLSEKAKDAFYSAFGEAPADPLDPMMPVMGKEETV